MLRLTDRQQRALNTFGNAEHSPASKISTTTTCKPSHSSSTGVRSSSGTPPCHLCTSSSKSGPAQGLLPYLLPSLVYLKLRSPFMVWVLSRLLLKRKLEGKRDVFIGFNDVKAMLGYSKKSKTMPSYVIREAINWGVLSKAWKGYYKINWEAVDRVANATVPKNIGTKALHNEYLTKGWFEVKEAKEVIREFNALLGGTRVYGSQLWLIGGLEPPAGTAGNTGFTPPTRKLKHSASAKPATPPPHFNHLTPTMIVIGYNMLPVLKLGSVYLLMEGIRGGAQSTFPCVKCTAPSGGTRYLCAGSESVLLELISYTGINPTCSVYGGDLSPTSLVADIPGRGLQPFDTAPADTPRLEPGIQVYNSALLAFAKRYNLYVGYSKALGLPAVEVVPRRVVYKELARGNLRLLSELPLILDALIGTVHSTLRQLPGIDSLSLRQLPRALLQGPPPPAGGTVTVHVVYKLEVDGHKTRRITTTLSNFIALLRHHADRGKKVRVLYLKLIIPLVGADASGLSDTLNYGFLYIYNNSRKDPSNAVRIELRPYAGVKHAVGKYGLLDLLVRALRELLPALEATHRALVPWLFI